MNYLSDDEDNINVTTEPTLEELYPEEEMDEEIIAIIRKHACKEVNNDFSYQIKEKTNLEKEKPNLKKDKFSESEIEEMIKKSWYSTKFHEKNKNKSVVVKEIFFKEGWTNYITKEIEHKNKSCVLFDLIQTSK